MKVWFTSDLHFGHRGIVNFMNRPFEDVEDMDSSLIERWNEVVEPQDQVYVIGDFSFHRPERTTEILAELKGQKFLIKGNHDHTKALKKIRGWTWVKDYHEFKQDGHLAVLCHYPFRVWRNSHWGSFHFHGHSHGSLPPIGRMQDVGVDIWDFYPISWEWLKSSMLDIEVQFPDHHKERKP